MPIQVENENVKHLLSEFYAACDDVNATQKDKLQACTWIIAREAKEAPGDMTQGWHVVDVLTRVLIDLNDTLRGLLSRYGNNGYPSK